MSRGDQNAPANLQVPYWGPDKTSLRMTLANQMFSNPSSLASIGIGVRPAPSGASFTEGVKSNTWMAPQQNFRGFVAKTTDPTIKNVASTASLPAANAQLNPILLLMSLNQINGSGA